MSSALIVSHAADLDGVASAVVLYYHLMLQYGAADVLFVNYEDALDVIQKKASKYEEVWISDLSWKLNASEGLIEALAHIHPEKRVLIDHHASSSEMMKAWENQARIIFDASGRACATDLAWETVRDHLWDVMRDKPLLDEYFQTLEQLVHAAHSRDLWIKNDPMGDTLTDILTQTTPEKMFQVIIQPIFCLREYRFPPEWKEMLEKARASRALAIKAAENSLLIYPVPVTDDRDYSANVMACFTTGHSSDVAEKILQDHGAGWLAMINVKGNTISLRTTQETIDKTGIGVHSLASKLHPSGGGHPCAAGCPLDVNYLHFGTAQLVEDMLWILDPSNP